MRKTPSFNLYQRLEEEVNEHQRVLTNYQIELQNSSFIVENTTKDEHAKSLKRLSKLQAKIDKVRQRLARLRKQKDPSHSRARHDIAFLDDGSLGSRSPATRSRRSRNPTSESRAIKA